MMKYDGKLPKLSDPLLYDVFSFRKTSHFNYIVKVEIFHPFLCQLVRKLHIDYFGGFHF